MNRANRSDLLWGIIATITVIAYLLTFGILVGQDVKLIPFEINGKYIASIPAKAIIETRQNNREKQIAELILEANFRAYDKGLTDALHSRLVSDGETICIKMLSNEKFIEYLKERESLNKDNE